MSGVDRKIGVGTGCHGTSVNVTEIKNLLGAMMTTSVLGKTDLVTWTGTNEIPLSGLTQGTRQPRIRPRPSQQQALHQINQALIVLTTLTEHLIQIRAGDHPGLTASFTTERLYNVPMCLQVAQNETVLLNNSRNRRLLPHRPPRYLLLALYLTRHRPSSECLRRPRKQALAVFLTRLPHSLHGKP